MPEVVIEVVCERCGTTTHAPAAERFELATTCACGGQRQVVRVFTDRRLNERTTPQERGRTPSG